MRVAGTEPRRGSTARRATGRWCLTVLAVASLFAGGALADYPEGANLQLSRVPDDGPSGAGRSHRPSVAIGGRYVAFRSSAQDLMSDDNMRDDIFLWDAETGEITAVSSNSASLQDADGSSEAPTISPDGRFVVFNSWASNLPGGNGVCQTFLLDRGDPEAPLPRHDVEVVSVASGSMSGVGNGQCAVSGLQPSVSDDGRFVGFSSTSTNLVSDDLQFDLLAKEWQVFVRDRELGHTYRLPDPGDPLDLSPNGPSYEVRLDASGRRAVFSSLATDIPYGDNDGKTDLFVWELPEHGGEPQITQRIDIDATGGAEFDISGDGRWVVFETTLPLDPDDDATSSDAYRVGIGGGTPLIVFYPVVASFSADRLTSRVRRCSRHSMDR